MDEARLFEATEKLRDAVKGEATTILSEACENGAEFLELQYETKERDYRNYNSINEAPRLASHCTTPTCLLKAQWAGPCFK